MKGFGDQDKSKNKKESNKSIKLSKEKIITQAFKFQSKGNIVEAVKYYQYFINQGFNDPRVFSNYGIILSDLGKLKEAEILHRKAIEIKSDYANAHANLGLTLRNLGKLKEAEISLRKAIKLNPDLVGAHSNLGLTLRDLGKLKEAELALRKAVELNPDLVSLHSNLGLTLRDLGKLKEAEISLRKAIKMNPSFAVAYYNLGNLLKKLGKLKEAELYIRKAIEIKPNYAQAHNNLGNILREFKKFPGAINHYIKAIKFNNKLSVAKSNLIEAKGIICDWSNQEAQTIWLDQLGLEGSSVNPLGLFYCEDNPGKQLERSMKYYKEKYYRESNKIYPLRTKKIRIGYFSSDFRDHPTMHLIASIFKLHDKSKFEIYLYSFAQKEDKYTEIAKNSGCIFKDIKELDDLEAVQLARNDQLDIAIDLMGYIKSNRMNIFSYRVAPKQINYLGYPGSLGANTIDYIIADNIVIPDGYEKFYSEKILRMPHCYQCNDNQKEICKEPIFRKDFNLPNQGFIFVCFNANKKITQNEFDIWMRLLMQIEGSVLWLYRSNSHSSENLMKEAEKRNVDKNRLIFANNLPLKKHLARYSLGDLALDTFNYNGHTTTSDALWSGLPVLTKIGESFAARVSASILTSIDLPELITYNEKEYEDTALNIARNPDKLIRLKTKLAKSRETSPLYKSELYTKNLENKFKEIVS